MSEFRFTATISKQEPEQRRFWGAAYLHRDSDGNQITDVSGDTVDTPEAETALEEAFYKYVRESRSGDVNHELFDAADMIEGYVVTKDKKTAGLFPPETPEGIYVGFQARATPAGDTLWDGVKTGRYTALSIVGEGRSEVIA